MTIDKNRIQEVLDQCSEEADRLNKWEQGFLESVIDQYDRTGYLSGAQLEKLEQIHCKLP